MDPKKAGQFFNNRKKGKEVKRKKYDSLGRSSQYNSKRPKRKSFFVKHSGSTFKTPWQADRIVDPELLIEPEKLGVLTIIPTGGKHIHFPSGLQIRRV